MGSAVVAYTDPQGFFGRHEDLVEQNLRNLTNIHWRPSLDDSELANQRLFPGIDTTLRTVPLLKLQLSPEGSHKTKQHQIPGLNKAPLVQILVIETAPVEIYRNKLRHIGKDWFQKQVEVREPTGYVVVHATAPNENLKATKAIWSRLTAEFDAANCVQLVPSAKDSWAHLRMLMQEQLIRAFDARVNMLEGEIKKLSATRDIPGWNFGTMFAMHESLARAYEAMNLLDDALKVYARLEAMVAEIPIEQWPSQPQTPTLSFSGDRDILIDPILAQTASYFDVQRHLLARKVSLLLSLAESKRHGEEMVDSLADQYVTESIRVVLGRLPMLLNTLKQPLGEWKAYSWLLKTIRELFILITEVGSSKLNQGKGDLIMIERDAVQKLGALKGWCIPGVFNDISLDAEKQNEVGENEDKQPEDKKAVNELDNVFDIESESSYRQEFLRITRQAIVYNRIANMSRVVSRLTAQLMLVEYHQGNIDQAWEILEKTPSLLNLSQQQQPIVSVLDVALNCAGKLKLEERVSEFAWKIISLDQMVPEHLFEKAVSKAQESNSSKSAEHDLNIWFEPRIRPYLRGDDNGYYLELELIPKRQGHSFVSLENAVITALAPTGTTNTKPEILFESSDVSTSNVIKLYTKTFKEGHLELEKLEIHHKMHTFVHKIENTFVAMCPLSNAFTANVILAKFHTMRKRNIELHITSPKEVTKAKVHVQPIDQHLQLLWDKAEGANGLVNFKSTVVKIPVLVDYDHPKSKIKVIIEYDDQQFEFYKSFDFTLAVSVDFQEYFREPPRILSQFFVKPFNNIPTIFNNAVLSSSRNYQVDEFASNSNNQRYVAYVNAPVSYVFGIAKRKQEDRELTSNMELMLNYRSMLWECQHIFYESCKADIAGKGLECYLPEISRVVEILSPRVNMAEYLITGRVTLSDLGMVTSTINSVFQYMDPEHAKEIKILVTGLLEKGMMKDEDMSFEELNSTMTLEVPDPDAEIVHYVQLDLRDAIHNETTSEKPKEYVVGGVIPATLTIETVSFQENDISDRTFEYELDRLSEGWSYTGKVKGIFHGTSKVHETFNLIPNRSGELLVPNIIIKPAELKKDDTDSRVGNESDSDRSVSVSVLEEPDVDDMVVVAKHANNRILVVPDVNMLAITF